jgi:hypothetical protein
MKPTLTKFPSVDCNYHSIALGGFNGRCAKVSAPSFLNISRDYFRNEARHDFAGEAAFFAMIIVTTAVPLVSGAYAVIELCRAFGAL